MAQEVRASIALPASVWKAVKLAAIREDKLLKDWVREALEVKLGRKVK